MEAFQLIKSQPDQTLIYVCALLLPKQACNIGDGGLPITILPDKCRRAVQAMRLIRLQIINQRLIRKVFDYQFFCAGLWELIRAVITHLDVNSSWCWTHLRFAKRLGEDLSGNKKSGLKLQES